MIKCYQHIFYGSPTGRLPDVIYTYTMCPNGRYIYLVGANYFIRSSADLSLVQDSALWIYDCVTLNMMVFELNYEIYSGKLVDFYSLNARRCVLMMHNADTRLLTQYCLWINLEHKMAFELFGRNWRFEATEALRVGYGALEHGYIVISGYTTAEYGNALDVRLLPADPQSAQFPAINMDKQIANLESLIKEYPSNVHVWPGSVPLMTANGLYFLLARQSGGRFIFETTLIGGIEFLPNGQYEAKLIGIDNLAISHLSERELSINYVSMLAQRNRTCWMTAAVPADPSHWRHMLQKLAVKLSTLILIYLGTFCLWLRRFDGGYCASWFGRIFFWINGGRLVPNIGPNPTFNIFMLDMQKWRIIKKEFQVNCTWLRLGGQAMIDVSNDGSATLCEVTQECNQFRLTKFPPPFVPSFLRSQALDRCYQLYPTMRSGSSLRLQCGVQEYPCL